MSTLLNYKAALLKAIAEYEFSQNNTLSRHRQNDVKTLRAIINDPKNNSPFTLQQQLQERMKHLKTGWWLFQTGRSQLRTNLFKVMQQPEYTPEKILSGEINQANTTLQQLEQQIYQKQRVLIAQQLQLKIQNKMLRQTPYFINYEEYLINLLDKLLAKQPLTQNETKQITWAFKEVAEENISMIEPMYQEFILEKMAALCEFSFRALLTGLDFLCIDQQLPLHALQCISDLAYRYCEILKSNPQREKDLTRLINKLIRSYCEDGAGKSTNKLLSADELSQLFAIKESFIMQFGNKTQKESMQSLFELRLTGRWQAFKEACEQRGKDFYQWLRQRSTGLFQTPQGSGVKEPGQMAISNNNPTDIDRHILTQKIL